MKDTGRLVATRSAAIEGAPQNACGTKPSEVFGMTDDSRFVELARLAHDAFDSRRRYEWRISFSLWGGLAAIGYWAHHEKVRVFDSSCGAIGIGGVVVLLYLASLLLINFGHAKDKAWKRYYMTRAVGKAEPAEPTRYGLAWTQVAWCACQTGFTLLLTWLVMKTLLGVPPATP